jgi:hypothetical protein
MNQVLNITAACCAIVGVILWFLAAKQTRTPRQAAYWGVTDNATSPFARAWRKATLLNQAAAGMTGISALLFLLSAFCKP